MTRTASDLRDHLKEYANNGRTFAARRSAICDNPGSLPGKALGAVCRPAPF